MLVRRELKWINRKKKIYQEFDSYFNYTIMINCSKIFSARERNLSGFVDHHLYPQKILRLGKNRVMVFLHIENIDQTQTQVIPTSSIVNILEFCSQTTEFFKPMKGAIFIRLSVIPPVTMKQQVADIVIFLVLKNGG